MSKVITRFAPSPTGYLHLGGARTALFNYLFAKKNGGQYLLRIEDTDKVRSTESAIKVILDGLAWLGIQHDGEVVLQSSRKNRHQEIAQLLVEKNLAYHCYSSPEELAELKKQNKGYDRKWRDRDEADRKKMLAQGINPAVRIKMPLTGATTIDDWVQGAVKVENETLDDFILLRSDGDPTYMLSVVVDDIDMAISHVIRGSDHLTNSFRQYHLWRAVGEAMGQEIPPPQYAHVPLILNDKGEKLSKRNGAAAVTDYQDLGILPEAMVNYLLRLGWSHGDEEIISMVDAIRWFDLGQVGASPSRTDEKKLFFLNKHYLIEADDDRLAGLLDIPKDNEVMMKLLSICKLRAKDLGELKKMISDLSLAPVFPLADTKLMTLLQNSKAVLLAIYDLLLEQKNFDKDSLHQFIADWGKQKGYEIKDMAPSLRIALSGLPASPGTFDLLSALGREESLKRIETALKNL